MSNKITTFQKQINRPLGVYNFVVMVPGFSTEQTFVVQSSEFPTETMGVLKLHIQGEEVRYRAKPTNSGSWKFTIPENEDATMYKTFRDIMNSVYNQKTGRLTREMWGDVVVMMRDADDNPIFKTTLKGAWLRGKDGVALDAVSAEKPWLWTYEFMYQYPVEDTNLK